MHRHPTILRVMTPFPHSIDASAGLDEAAEMMESHGFHHLPVKRGEALIGVVSARDVALAREAERRGARRLDVQAICSRDFFEVDVARALAWTVREMARRHADAVLVTRDGHLVGILTATDVCLALAELLDPDLDDEIA